MFHWTASSPASVWCGKFQIKYKTITGVRIAAKELERASVSYFKGGIKMSKQISTGIVLAACVALCAAVWPWSTEVEELPPSL